jgi:hypothetical protein
VVAGAVVPGGVVALGVVVAPVADGGLVVVVGATAGPLTRTSIGVEQAASTITTTSPRKAARTAPLPWLPPERLCAPIVPATIGVSSAVPTGRARRKRW